MSYMDRIGTTEQTGIPLYGGEENGIRLYFLKGGKLVAVAVGNLEETSLTRYFCLPDIWTPNSQTSIVDEATLLNIVREATSVAG